MTYPKLFAACISFLLVCGISHAIEIPTAYKNVARLHGVPEKILFSIALAESMRYVNDRYIAWPWTINVEGEGVYFDSRKEMQERIAAELFRGKRSIDVGPMQVNLKYHAKRFNGLDNSVLPEANLNVASEILMEQYIACDLDWWCAVGRYHSPGNKERALVYRERVREWYDKL